MRSSFFVALIAAIATVDTAVVNRQPLGKIPLLTQNIFLFLSRRECVISMIIRISAAGFLLNTLYVMSQKMKKIVRDQKKNKIISLSLQE